MDFVKEKRLEIEVFKSKIERVEEQIQDYYERVAENITRDMLRPMRAKDVKEGQFYVGWGDDGWYCRTIEEVYYPNDDFKAFCADDGCRYGLYESYILL